MDLQDHLFFVTKVNKRFANLESELKQLTFENQELKESIIKIKKYIDDKTAVNECYFCDKETNKDLEYNDRKVCLVCYNKLYEDELY